MRQFRTLLGYEMKKICCRKSTWITFAVLISAFLLSTALTWSITYENVSQEQEEDTGEIKEEAWHDTYAERKARERKNGLYWSGRTIDNVLFAEVKKEYGKAVQKAAKGAGTHELFTKEMERFEPVEAALEAITGEGNLLVQNYDSQKGAGLTEEKIYEARDALVENFWQEYRITEKERSYWQEKEELLSKPFTMEYAEGFYQLISMNGVYMVFMFASFLLAVVVGRIFAEEHQRRLDQLILCSRFGRRQLYFAKITAGILFAAFAVTVMMGVIAAVNLFVYGAEGFSAAIQLIAGWYSYPLTVGTTFLVMLGISLLAAILTSIFIMAVSERFCSSTVAMAAVIAVTGGARLVVIPREFRILSQIWNYFPINLLKVDQGFLDVRLVSVFGVKLTSWQFAPVLYLLLGVLFVLLGKRFYCRYQVQGR